MEPNLDILEVIGSHCDPLTKVNLCLASKDYFEVSRNGDVDYRKQIRLHFMRELDPMIKKALNTLSRLEKLRQIHKVYRFMVDHKYAFDLLSEVRGGIFRTKTLEKLDEFVAGGMSKRKATKYRKTLSV